MGGEAAVGAAVSFIPGIGRGKKGKRGGKKKVDKEIHKDNHSHNRDKRSSDHDERHRENEQQGKKKKCKVRQRSRRATGPKRLAPSKANCDDDDDDDDEDDDTKFCPKFTFQNLLKKSKTHTSQCERIREGRTCDFECNPGYDEKPDHHVKCIKSADKLRWNQQGSRCEAESCVAKGAGNYLIVLSTPKPRAPNGKKMTAYVILYNKNRKIPTWSVALHDSSEFGLTDLTGLTARESAGRHGSFLKHPCSELRLDQANDQSYASTGWQKGHLTPARVIRWSLKATRSVNLYVNVAPQDGVTNEQIWERIEDNAFCTAQKIRSIVATGTCAGMWNIRVERLEISRFVQIRI